MTHLLDTNACIAIMRGHEQACLRMQSYAPTDLAISSVTLFELLAGVERCRQPERERCKVEHLMAPLHLVPFDAAAAAESARLRWHLERQGMPIGPYDFQLAGQALALDLILVTHNTREFERVPNLRLEDWQDS
jgi:tRNA(fMet)-specific endonuclease VapC